MSTLISDSAPNSVPTADIAAESDALIIGLGNLLLSDEGVGIHVLRRLEQQYGFAPSSVELVDGGTTGLDLLALFQEHNLILLIDALFAPDSAPGDIQILRNDAILAALSKKLSMHHLGISDVLALAQLLDYRPREIVLLGVVPENLELGTELSTPVEQRLPDILTSVQTILSDWHIAMKPHKPGIHAPSPTGAALFLADPVSST
ncbi:HyaD/HybD family hydrogenase maturation endopeptidase [Thiorhodovibrio frisius]|uniref:Hydrogenase maturation protease n=1 Tax=Thiorhodovibrio frisius TaxID=631362 RepID=H8Z5K9_9GAMM|nr:HyaD/HybD family hydrogenase maturation endopeptidase [Thiorhodovibrio frisius]EIC20579.1 hydrogenase maturation protease [Thiorhodovibrio frisius]WPL21328.1 Hydrogenase 2 maturation protease [Thiorhodovibrio frisius]